MIEISNRISLSERIYNNEYAYVYGDKKNEIVDFVYVHKSGREITKHFTYTTALKLAYDRAKDKRYKNYNFAIW